MSTATAKAKPKAPPSILDVLSGVFGSAFAPSDSWRPWRVALSWLFGLPMDGDALALGRACTGRTDPPTTPAREGWFIVGRRGGKSRVAALVAVFLAAFRTYALPPGERGVLMVIAADRKQARVVFRYVVGLLEAHPSLAAMIERRTKDSVRLTNGIDIEIHTASYRAVRGYTVVGVVADEVGFWPTEESGASPDSEILGAVRPAMATIAGSLLVAISTPYARRGALWSAFEKHYGRDGDVLVWRADSATMNPSIDPHVIEDAYAEDPASAAAEFGATFRTDVESFVSREAIEACVIPGRFELPAASGMRYMAFLDPAGGSGKDSMTLAVGHLAEGRVVLDALRESRPPFSPAAVSEEITATCRGFGVGYLHGDRWGGEWPREHLRAHGVGYEVCPVPKSDLYTAMLPLINSGSVELLDHPRLVGQLLGLERKTARGGRDTVDHAPSGHDDLPNSVAGLCWSLGRLTGTAVPEVRVRGFGPGLRRDDPDPESASDRMLWWGRVDRHLAPLVTRLGYGVDRLAEDKRLLLDGDPAEGFSEGRATYMRLYQWWLERSVTGRLLRAKLRYSDEGAGPPAPDDFEEGDER